MEADLIKNLMADEQLLHRTYLHWIMYMKPLIIVLIGIVFIILINSLMWGIIFIIGGILYGLYLRECNNLSDFVITNKRIIAKGGDDLPEKSIEVFFSEAESICLSQTYLGEVFGYGNIIVIKSGGKMRVIRRIKKAFEFNEIARGEFDKTRRSKK